MKLKKSERIPKLLDCIRKSEGDIDHQDTLLDKFNEYLGYIKNKVVIHKNKLIEQPMISKDLKEIKEKYNVKKNSELREILRTEYEKDRLKEKTDKVVCYDCIDLLCVKTTIGNGRYIAHMIEQAFPDLVLGSISGDDISLIITTKSPEKEVNKFEEKNKITVKNDASKGAVKNEANKTKGDVNITGANKENTNIEILKNFINNKLQW